MAQFSTAKGHQKSELDKRPQYYADVQAERQARSKQVAHQQKMLAEGPGPNPRELLLSAAVTAQTRPVPQRNASDWAAINRADALFSNWRKLLPAEKMGICAYAKT